MRNQILVDAKTFDKQRGAGKLTTLVFGSLLVIILYCAYHILPFYYYYYELQNQFESHAKVAQVYTDKEIRDKLMYHINKMELPIKRPEDLRIERGNGDITISLKYRETFYVSWGGKDYDLYYFDFFPLAKASIK